MGYNYSYSYFTSNPIITIHEPPPMAQAKRGPSSEPFRLQVGGSCRQRPVPRTRCWKSKVRPAVVESQGPFSASRQSENLSFKLLLQLLMKLRVL